jgi:hypothetical protein
MFFATLVAATAMLASCDKEEIISESQLPSSSKTFLKTHFDGVVVTHVEKETDGLDKEYSVSLANGFTVEFTKSGAWDVVNGHITPLPQTILDLLPDGITEYVSTNHSDLNIVLVNKERLGYEIGLDDNTDINFNTSGGFAGYDD